MKKLVSILLSILMTVCMSTVVFADGYDVKINDVKITEDGAVTNNAIKSGTVTFKAPTATTPAKLILKNVVINSDDNCYAIYVDECDIVIELIGKNIIESFEEYCICANGNCTITGYGSLSMKSNSGYPVYFDKALTLDMRGTLTATGSSGNYAMCGTDFYMTPEAGKVIMHGDAIDYGVFVLNYDTGIFSGPDWIIGSTNKNETNESNMVPVTRRLDQLFIDEVHPNTAVFITAEARIGDTKYKTVQDAVNAANTGDTVVLLKDIKLDKCIKVEKGFILDLNGHVLDRNLIHLNQSVELRNEDYGSALFVNEDGNLTIIDSNPTRTHKFKKITDGNYKGLLVLDEDFGTEIITGGVITGGTGCKDSIYDIYSGGGISNNGTLVINAGNIVGNISDYGGGIYNNVTYPEVTITSANIIGNLAGCGGGIFNMNTLKIIASDNKEINITNNIASDAAGGVANYGDMHLSGKIIVKDNTCDEKYDSINYPINLETSEIIKIDGALTGSDINVSLADANNDKHKSGILTSGYTNNNPGAGNTDFFHYEGLDIYLMELNSSGELKIRKPIVTYDVQSHGVAPGPEEVDENLLIHKPSNPTADDFSFGGWYKDTTFTQAWNFDVDTVKQDMTLYAKWIPNSVDSATVSGNVTENSTGVPNATVELYLGTVKVAATKTNDNGQYSFNKVENGTYNIVVTDTDGKTMTILVTINTTGNVTVNVELPTSSVNSKVEHAGEKVTDTKSNIKQAVVGGLDVIAEAQTPLDGDKITIKLKVEPKKEEDVAGATEIKRVAGNGKKVEFIDMSLFKQVNNGEEQPIGDNNTQLLTIIIPFDFTNTDVDSVMIIRKHGANTIALNKGLSNAVDGEYFEIDDTKGTITIYAKKFSDYAIAYLNTGSNPPSSDPKPRYKVPNTGVK